MFRVKHKTSMVLSKSMSGNGVIVDTITLVGKGSAPLTLWVTRDIVTQSSFGPIERITAKTFDQSLISANVAWGYQSRSGAISGILSLSGFNSNSIDSAYRLQNCRVAEVDLAISGKAVAEADRGSKVVLNSNRLYDSQYPKALENVCK